MKVSRRFALTIAVGALSLAAGCSQTFRTSYTPGAARGAAAGWTFVNVIVNVPTTLTVSEEKTIAPKGDIIWREDPPGDRHQQVGAIMANAANQAVAGLSGPRQVQLKITLTRFHALSFEAEALNLPVGVHNVDFVAEVTDLATGQVLAGPETIEAALPALSGVEMIQARVEGVTQKSMITAHLRRTIAGWLGIGADNRVTFTRAGL